MPPDDPVRYVPIHAREAAGGSEEHAVEASGYAARPDYRVDILARNNLVTARLDDVEVARSSACLLVDEQDHGLVFYFPRDAVDLERFERTDHHSVCPFKGTASYWRPIGDHTTGVAWSYEDPYPEVARIAGYIAFYQDRVQVSVGTAPYAGTTGTPG